MEWLLIYFVTSIICLVSFILKERCSSDIDVSTFFQMLVVSAIPVLNVFILFALTLDDICTLSDRILKFKLFTMKK